MQEPPAVYKDTPSFIIHHTREHAADLASFVAQHYGISRQAANRHIRNLVTQGILSAKGSTRSKTYELAVLTQWERKYQIAPALAEDVVWHKDAAPNLRDLPRNVQDLWQFCFTEILNNAMDHSNGSEIVVGLKKTAADTEIAIADNGVGIFKKIQDALGLLDERHAVLELAKGKLTTSPSNHSGQGIFFSSRMMDAFSIHSGRVTYMHEPAADEDLILEDRENFSGTGVFMRLANDSARVDKDVFDQYSSGEDYGFTRTVVPVRLAQYGDDKLVSRSQAKRLLARIDRFRAVHFDFAGVEAIGQAFADEIFRVFARNHADIEMIPYNATPQVQQMINAARAALAEETGGI